MRRTLKRRYREILYYTSVRAASRYLKKYGLLGDIERMRETWSSSGVDLMDFACLHDWVRRHKPRCFLECGTGMSTHIIARAMSDYCRPEHGDIRLISMESEQQWYNEAVKRRPDEYRDFMEIVLSPVDYYRYGFVRGVVYRDVPDYPYECVFVDGPNPEDMCDMDFIRLVASSDRPVAGIVDERKTSVLAYTALLGRHNIRYYHFGLSFVSPVSRRDLIHHGSQQLKDVYFRNTRELAGSPIRAFLGSLVLSLWPMRFD